MLIHKGTSELETDRLILRRFTIDNAKDMFYNWANDSEVTRHLNWEPNINIQVTEEYLTQQIKLYARDDFYCWAILFKQNGQVIGSIDTFNISNNHRSCEMGFCLGKEYWNKGIMSEALRRVIEHLFMDIGFNRIQSTYRINNPASGKVLIKSGMKIEGRLRQYQVDKEGNYIDSNMLSIIKEDFKYS